MYLMYKAVQTAPARRAWEDGVCKEPERILGADWKPTEVFVIDFSD